MNLDGLAPGQVWELVFDDDLAPSLLLYHVHGPREGEYWRCLNLYNGVVFAASVLRWRDKGKYHDELVGERLA